MKMKRKKIWSRGNIKGRWNGLGYARKSRILTRLIPRLVNPKKTLPHHTTEQTTINEQFYKYKTEHRVTQRAALSSSSFSSISFSFHFFLEQRGVDKGDFIISGCLNCIMRILKAREIPLYWRFVIIEALLKIIFG